MTMGFGFGASLSVMETRDNDRSAPHDPGSSEPAEASSFPLSELTKLIIGGMFEVYNILGSGFLESIYANALAVELRLGGMKVERHVAFEIFYRGIPVGRYVADLIVESQVVVETKVARAIEAPHRAQLLNYLRATGLEVGLVLNFGAVAQFKRVVSTSRRSTVTAVRIVSDGENA
jgi:GxxExxY protein